MKYQNCLEIPAGAKFAVRTSTGQDECYIKSVETNTIVQRTESDLMADEGSVMFVVISGGMVDEFDDEHKVGMNTFLGLEDLFMEVVE